MRKGAQGVPGTGDEELIARIVRRQPEALADLYDRYGRLVYSLALYMVSDGGLAEEIVQDVFLQVWQRAASYDRQVGKVSTWLTSIARHRAIDMLRRRKVRPEGSWTGLDGLLEHAGEQQVEPEVLARGQQTRVLQALTGLPASQRQCLALAYFHGMTQQEIADLLGEPLGTVKTRIRLGMQKMRTTLEEHLEEWADGIQPAGPWGRPDDGPDASRRDRSA